MKLFSASIFIGFFLLSDVEGSEPDTDACGSANSEWQERNQKLFRTVDGILAVFEPIMRDPNADITANASVQAGAFCSGPQFRIAAESSENLIRQCSPTSDECRKRKPEYSFAPDVLRAAAQFCENAQMAEYIDHARTLAPCLAALVRRWTESLAAHNTTEPRVYRLVYAEADAAKDNSTVSCGLVNGRKYACRMVQIGNPPHTDVSNPHIRELCGQKAHDMVVMLRDRALNALNCSEFGDFVKDFGVFKVNYQANQTTSAAQH